MIKYVGSSGKYSAFLRAPLLHSRKEYNDLLVDYLSSDDMIRIVIPIVIFPKMICLEMYKRPYLCTLMQLLIGIDGEFKFLIASYVLSVDCH